MAVFRFRLERVLKVRSLQQEVLQSAMAGALRRFEIERRHLFEATEKLERRVEELRTLQRGPIRIDMTLTLMSYIERLEREVAESRRRLRERETELDRAREALVESARERKMLETLKERDRKTYLREIARREQAEQDEIGQQTLAARSGRA